MLDGDGPDTPQFGADYKTSECIKYNGCIADKICDVLICRERISQIQSNRSEYMQNTRFRRESAPFSGEKWPSPVVGPFQCVRYNIDIDIMFSPNLAPSTTGSGSTRARTPQGGLEARPRASRAMFPSRRRRPRGPPDPGRGRVPAQRLL